MTQSITYIGTMIAKAIKLILIYIGSAIASTFFILLVTTVLGLGQMPKEGLLLSDIYFIGLALLALLVLPSFAVCESIDMKKVAKRKMESVFGYIILGLSLLCFLIFAILVFSDNMVKI